MRIEIKFIDRGLDGRERGIAAKLSRRLGTEVAVAVVDVILPGALVSQDLARLVFSDPVVQTLRFDGFLAADPELSGWSWLVEVAWKPGVTDTLAITAHEALKLETGKDAPPVSTARQYLLFGILDRGMALRAASFLHNPLVQSSVIIGAAEWASGTRPPAEYAAPALHDRLDPEIIALAAMDDAALQELSSSRLLALTLPEMQRIRSYFADPAVREERTKRGLPVDSTDVEIEMLAQTWSEHCKHKIFNATIKYQETGKPTEIIQSLYKTYIKKTTEDLAPSKPFLRSVFTDNAGVVAFHEGSVLCVKAETHNSPSALDPYGGAITGIVGVNRDILGTGMGAKPLFNTNVLCFANPATPDADIPLGLMHPREVLEGVHKGIVDGGNQSGIPTVAGAFLFDESFMGKPLVFCGTGGIMPETVNGLPSWEKTVRPGALAVMLGGRVGKDGIHGATFSSLALDELSPVSAVQIGDPIIQRRMTDFLLEARDLGLYEAITDNGAGGLSSSLGEMAESSGGISIDLSKCPLKYPGLSPWEILVSESQERMSLSVAGEKIAQLAELALRRDVEATVVGEFTDSGYIEITANGQPAGLLSLEFLHRGLPAMEIPALWSPVARRHDPIAIKSDWTETLLRILADPNVASKEFLVRQYDHEVQGRSVEKPFTGIKRDAPSDGGVMRIDYTTQRGVSVTHGICPRYSDYDTAVMARMAVDEAYRAHIALGGDPGKAAALDNFCWPDPVESASTPDGAFKAAQLVRACKGLRQACLCYGLPLVSGKDSMKNDAYAGGRKISVRPTLLVTLMGSVTDVRKSISTDFLEPGNLIYVLGDTNGELGCTMFERIASSFPGPNSNLNSSPNSNLNSSPVPIVSAPLYGPAPDVDLERAKKLYEALAHAISGRIVRSCHDCSDGGIAVALAESCLGGRLGATVTLNALPRSGPKEHAYAEYAARALFCESGGRFVVSIRRQDRERFEATLRGSPHRYIGETTKQELLSIKIEDKEAIRVSLESIENAFKTPIV